MDFFIISSLLSSIRPGTQSIVAGSIDDGQSPGWAVLRLFTDTHAELAAIQAKIATLTPREREVFTHVVAGRLNKQIAYDLGTAEKTIKFHRSAVMRKLEVRTVADLVRMAEKANDPRAGDLA